MASTDPHAINRLMGRFTELQETWERDPKSFDWNQLEALAHEGAHAYNEGSGPSFHALALDAMQHGDFHERFLAASLQAGFDPFRLVQAGDGATTTPVIDHAGLAEDAQWNASSARMRAMLMDAARERYERVAQDAAQDTLPDGLQQAIEACAPSIPVDLLQRLSPELARRWHADNPPGTKPLEGYLSRAEVIVDRRNEPYG